MNSSKISKRILECLECCCSNEELRENEEVALYNELSQIDSSVVKGVIVRLCEKIEELNPYKRGLKPWYTENWWTEDIENALSQIGVPITEGNLNRMQLACKHIYDDKTERNEMLVDCASKTFRYYDLWREFSDVPMNPETEYIEEDWNGFPAGTHREEIWHWFEETFDVSVADLMGL